LATRHLPAAFAIHNPLVQLKRGYLVTPPTAITDHQLSRSLQIDWSDQTSSHLSHVLLRANCRCAQCVQLRRGGQLPETDPAVALVRLEPVGEQGLNLGFSDGHDRGIYPWSYLHELATSLAMEARA
jgi:DUF971 family protein